MVATNFGGTRVSEVAGVTPYHWPEDKEPKVGIIMGSDSDMPKVSSAHKTLTELEIPWEMDITSAHRTPELMAEYASAARKRGLHVLLAVAGGSAHLQGMTSGHTRIPVFGIAVGSSEHSYNASVQSQIEMPPGVPLGEVGGFEAGAKNGALLAARILALHDDELDARLEAYIQRMKADNYAKRERLAAIGPDAYIEELKAKNNT